MCMHLSQQNTVYPNGTYPLNIEKKYLNEAFVGV